MAIVTIAHQLGSNGRQIGQALAQALDLDYIDRQIVAGVAQQMGIPEETATDMDEKAQSVIMRIISLFNVGGPMLIAPNYDAATVPVNEREYFEATRKVIEAATVSKRAVIAGHGANFALGGKIGVLNVFVYAPTSVRERTIMARDKIGKAEAHQKLHENDNNRAHYIKTFYNANWQDPKHYHLMLNTAVINTALAVELITTALKKATF